MRKEKGYSLLETMVVSGVVLMASAATLPSIIKTSKQYKLKAVTQQIDQALQAAKYDAIRENTSKSVYFDLANNRFTMSNGTEFQLPDGITFAGLGSTSAPSMIVNGAAAGTAAALATQQSNSKMSCSFPVDPTSSSKRMATFTPRGVPSVEPGAFNWVYLKNDNGEMSAITLSSAGSTVSFTKMAYGSWKCSSGSSSSDGNYSNSGSGSSNSNSGSGSSGS